MSEKLNLKVGDRVRLTGDQWSRDSDYPVEKGDIVTVDYFVGDMAYGADTENLTTLDGEPLNGYEVEKVEETPTEVPEVREVNLYTVAAGIETIIKQMVALGFDWDDARTIVRDDLFAFPEDD